MSRLRSSLSKLFYNIIWRLTALRDGRDQTSKWFPTCQGTNFLYAPLFPQDDGRAYFTKYHAEKANNPLAVNFKRYKADIVKGRAYSKGDVCRLRIDEPSAVPYAITGVDIVYPIGDYRAQLKVNGKEMNLGGLVADRFYYLPFREPADIELSSPHDIVVGDPIAFTQNKRHAVRMALVLFIDNFTWEIVDRLRPEVDLPNISKFFAKGTVFENCHSASNWTLPGVGTLVSGKTLTGHGMFHHARRDVLLGDSYPVLAELFHADGYLTFQACGNTRKSPRYGYVKGFDRTVYKNEMSLAETLDAFFEHLRAFPERDHFVWLTIFDAHHTLADVPAVANQLAVPLHAHDYRTQKAKSPMMLEANDGSTLRYIEELKRIDFHLGSVFEMIEARYSEDEVMACVVADHGTGFTTADPHVLSAEKTHVTFMLRGPGVPAGGHATELVQNTDIMPTLLKVVDIASPTDVHGRVPQFLGGPPARQWVLSEVKYVNKPYLASVKDEDFHFYFETEGLVDDEGDFAIGKFKTSLFRKRDWNTDVSADHPDKVALYTKVVREHIGK